MRHVSVLGFETNLQNLELLAAVLHQQQVPYVLRCIPLEGDTVPLTKEYFRQILERHRPKLLITSWCHIGPVVRKAEQTMTEPRPIEKWIISGYSLQTLIDRKATGWADEIYHKPVSPLELIQKIQQRLQRISPESLAHPAIY